MNWRNRNSTINSWVADHIPYNVIIFKLEHQTLYLSETVYTYLACIVGCSVQQYVSQLPVGITAPLPCISNPMSHYTGGVNFTRNWTEYENGFGNFAGSDFWIGNENIH